MTTLNKGLVSILGYEINSTDFTNVSIDLVELKKYTLKLTQFRNSFYICKNKKQISWTQSKNDYQKSTVQ